MKELAMLSQSRAESGCHLQGPETDFIPVESCVVRGPILASFQNPQRNPGETDPSNTTVFVGGLDPNVSDDHLKQVFSQCGEVVHVRIPIGKRCGFVQYSDRPSAERALSALNGVVIGGQSVRLSWGHSPSSKQSLDAPQYGYTQGYEGFGGGYPPTAQDPNMYYGGYPTAGYANYQQQQQYQHPPQ